MSVLNLEYHTKYILFFSYLLRVHRWRLFFILFSLCLLLLFLFSSVMYLMSVYANVVSSPSLSFSFRSELKQEKKMLSFQISILKFNYLFISINNQLPCLNLISLILVECFKLIEMSS